MSILDKTAINAAVRARECLRPTYEKIAEIQTAIDHNRAPEFINWGDEELDVNDLHNLICGYIELIRVVGNGIEDKCEYCGSTEQTIPYQFRQNQTRLLCVTCREERLEELRDHGF